MESSSSCPHPVTLHVLRPFYHVRSCEWSTVRSTNMITGEHATSWDPQSHCHRRPSHQHLWTPVRYTHLNTDHCLNTFVHEYVQTWWLFVCFCCVDCVAATSWADPGETGRKHPWAVGDEQDWAGMDLRSGTSDICHVFKTFFLNQKKKYWEFQCDFDEFLTWSCTDSVCCEFLRFHDAGERW